MKVNYPILSIILILFISSFILFNEAETKPKIIPKDTLSDPSFSSSLLTKTTEIPIAFPVQERDSHLCNDKNTLTSQLTDLKLLLTKNLIDFEKKLNNDNYTVTEKKDIIESFGLSFETYRKTTSWHAGADYTDLRTTKEKPIKLKGDDFFEFLKYYESKDYDNILTFIKANNLTSSTVFGGESILSSLMKNDVKIGSNIINQLIIAGLEPNFSDLVTATKMNIPLNLIERLMLDIKEPIDKVWYENYHQNTLAMTAAENLNVPLFNYWVNLGIKLKANSLDYTVLDVIKKPSNQEELESAINIFRTAQQHNIKPYKKESVELIQAWLPLDIQGQFPVFSSQPLINDWRVHLPKNLSEAELQEFQNFNARFQVTHNNVNEIELAIKSCETIAQKSKPNKQKSNIVEAFTHLDAQQEMIIDTEKKAIIENKMAMLTNLRALLTAKDWKGYLLALKEFPIDTRDTLTALNNMAMMQLITENAPSPIIEELILEGATLNIPTLHLFISTDNTDLAKELLPYHLDYEDIFGNKANLVQFAKGMRASPEMLKFLNEF